MRRQGQHFLNDCAILGRIASYAELKASDVVLEIGPGTGFLTEFLAPKAKQVYAIEVDPDLATGLTADLKGRFPNVDIVRGDALKVDLPAYNKIVSNLPYQISTKITLRLLPRPFDLAVLMYQKEFAVKMMAGPGTPDYGKLSVITAHYARAEIVEYVPRSAFRPEPHVDSAIVRLWPRHDRADVDDDLFMRLVTTLFGNRRKKIKRALAMMGVTKTVLARIDPSIQERRPETLSLDDFISLTKELSQPSA
jgi:16S rRNA (adenine1518-N6/adenine1519-N6)-dimethyltransferase